MFDSECSPSSMYDPDFVSFGWIGNYGVSHTMEFFKFSEFSGMYVTIIATYSCTVLSFCYGHFECKIEYYFFRSHERKSLSAVLTPEW